MGCKLDDVGLAFEAGALLLDEGLEVVIVVHLEDLAVNDSGKAPLVVAELTEKPAVHHDVEQNGGGRRFVHDLYSNTSITDVSDTDAME